MAWSKDKKLMQVQVEEDLYSIIEELAARDRRSITQEVIWLIEQGISRRDNLLAQVSLVETAERQGAKGPGIERAISEPARRSTRDAATNQAAVLSWVVAQLYDPGKVVSRYRAGKMIYLIEQATELGLFVSYLKHAAGPYDPKLRYGGPEKIALVGHRWLRATDESHFEPGPEIEEAIDRAEKVLDAASAKKVIRDFRKYTNGTLERWTTVDMAAREIIADGGKISAETVLAHINAIPQWAAKLEREEFELDKVAKTIEGLRKLGYLKA